MSVFHLTMMALGTIIGGSFFLGSSVAILALYSLAYLVMKSYEKVKKPKINDSSLNRKAQRLGLSTEFSEELTKGHRHSNKNIKNNKKN